MKVELTRFRIKPDKLHESGEPVETSSHDIDTLHRAFERECIDLTYGAVDPVPQLVLIHGS